MRRKRREAITAPPEENLSPGKPVGRGKPTGSVRVKANNGRIMLVSHERGQMMVDKGWAVML